VSYSTYLRLPRLCRNYIGIAWATLGEGGLGLHSLLRSHIGIPKGYIPLPRGYLRYIGATHKIFKGYLGYLRAT
jgi:hypothetical protein